MVCQAEIGWTIIFDSGYIIPSLVLDLATLSISVHALALHLLWVWICKYVKWQLNYCNGIGNLLTIPRVCRAGARHYAGSQDAHCTINRAQEKVNYAFCHIPHISIPRRSEFGFVLEQWARACNTLICKYAFKNSAPVFCDAICVECNAHQLTSISIPTPCRSSMELIVGIKATSLRCLNVLVYTLRRHY